MLIAAIYCIAAYGFGRFPRALGFIMLGMFAAYMIVNVMQMKNAPAEPAEDVEKIPLAKTLLLLVVGVVQFTL